MKAWQGPSTPSMTTGPALRVGKLGRRVREEAPASSANVRAVSSSRKVVDPLITYHIKGNKIYKIF